MGGCVMGPRKRVGALSGENPEPERKARSRFFRSITARLTAFALLISILPVVTISSLMTFRMEKMIESELQQSYGWLVREHLSHVEEKLRQYENSLLYTSRNTTILENLTGDAGDAYVRARRQQRGVQVGAHGGPSGGAKLHRLFDGGGESGLWIARRDVHRMG